MKSSAESALIAVQQLKTEINKLFDQGDKEGVKASILANLQGESNPDRWLVGPLERYWDSEGEPEAD